MFICGDFNIDLLNPHNHKRTEDFINTVFSLYPQITRPSRITSHCATLIDNIFTNSIQKINDISDHLPIFTVYDSNYILNRHGIKPISKRVRTEETMEAFKVDLLAQDWEFIGNEKDVDKAYEEFLRIFKLLYMIKISQLKYIAGNKKI